jgi:hypothetical protein
MHSSDCDVLAVRPPFVYEEVGGREDDWDPWLTGQLNFTGTLGIVCEVKSGDYEIDRLFREEVLRYAIARLGFVPIHDVTAISEALQSRPVVVLQDGTQIAKLLVARDEAQGSFLMRRLGDVEDFLIRRIKRYPKEKYADRMFFGPVLFQTLIELTARPKRRPRI